MLDQYQEISKHFADSFFDRRIVVNTDGSPRCMGLWQSFKAYMLTSKKDRQAQNKQVVNNFIDLMRDTMGHQAGNIATEILQKKIHSGDKLHARDVRRVLKKVESTPVVEYPIRDFVGAKFKTLTNQIMSNIATASFMRERSISLDEAVAVCECMSRMNSNVNCFNQYFELDEKKRAEHPDRILIEAAILGISKIPPSKPDPSHKSMHVYVGPMLPAIKDMEMYQKGGNFLVAGFYRAIDTPSTYTENQAWLRIKTDTARDLRKLLPPSVAIMRYVFLPGTTFQSTGTSFHETALICSLTDKPRAKLDDKLDEEQVGQPDDEKTNANYDAGARATDEITVANPD